MNPTDEADDARAAMLAQDPRLEHLPPGELLEEDRAARSRALVHVATAGAARLVLDPSTELAALAQRLTALVRTISDGAPVPPAAADDVAIAAGVCLAAIALVPDTDHRNLAERATCTR